MDGFIETGDQLGSEFPGWTIQVTVAEAGFSLHAEELLSLAQYALFNVWRTDEGVNPRG